jgi:hypothetical protein
MRHSNWTTSEDTTSVNIDGGLMGREINEGIENS